MMNSTISYIVYSLGRITPSGVNLLGTCFYVGKNMFATAAHVTGNDDNGLVLVLNKCKTIEEYQDTTNKQVEYMKVVIHATNPLRDVCLVELENVINLPTVDLDTLDSVKIGEMISIYGYPHSDHGRLVLTQQITSVGAKILNEASGIKNKSIVLNIQSRPGQSGSPIFKLNSSKIVAMLIGSYAPSGARGGVSIGGIDPQTLHQTTHAISAEYIKELL